MITCQCGHSVIDHEFTLGCCEPLCECNIEPDELIIKGLEDKLPECKSALQRIQFVSGEASEYAEDEALSLCVGMATRALSKLKD